MTIIDTDLATQVAQLRADVERLRLDPEVMWVTRAGRVRHLLHEALIEHPRPTTPWTFHIILTDLTPASPDDDRPVCCKCESERGDRHNWKTVQAEREHEQLRQREEELRAYDAARDEDYDRLDTTMESISAGTERLKELGRSRHPQRRRS